MTHSRPAVRELLDQPGSGAAARPRPELRRRPEHRAPHRPPRRRRPGRPGRRGRRRARLADARPRRDGRRRDGRRGRPRARRRVLRDVVADVPNVTVVEADAMTLDWDGAARRRRRVGARRQPAVQRRHAARVRPARRRAGDRADAGDGAARGRPSASRRRRARPAYGAVSVKVAYWAAAAHRRRRAGVGVRAPPERRVGARRDRPPATASTSRPSRCSRSCAPRSGSAARCCAARSPAS